MPCEFSHSATSSTFLRLRQYTMPELPLCRARKVLSCARALSRSTIAYEMLGRSKLVVKTRAVSSPSRSMMSARVVGSAVAVSAMRGTPG